MTLEDGLYAHLALATAPVGSALAAVRTQLADADPIVIRRLWAIQLRQGVDRWPALTNQRIGDGRRVWSHGGPNGLVETRLQLDAWARDPPTARGDALTTSLADALRRAVDGFVGQWGTVLVQQVRLDSERATYDPDTPARLWRRSQDYLIWYEEDVT